MKNLFKSWLCWGFALLVFGSSFWNNQSLNSSPQTVSATNQYQQVDSANKLNAQTKPTEAPTENGTTSTSEVETTPDNTVTPANTNQQPNDAGLNTQDDSSGSQDQVEPAEDTSQPQVTSPSDAPQPQDNGLSNDNYYTNTNGNMVHSPAYETQPNVVPSGASAVCGDGTYSFSQSRRGTCSHHEGVAQWL